MTDDGEYEAIMAQARLRFLEASRTALAALHELEPRLAEHPRSEELITALRRDVHRMSGSAGTFGFEAVSRMCAAFETVVRRWAADESADTDRRATILRYFTSALAQQFETAGAVETPESVRPLYLVDLPRDQLVGVVSEAFVHGFRPEWMNAAQFAGICDDELPVAVVAPRGIAVVEGAHAVARVLLDVAGAPPMASLDSVGRVRVLAADASAREVLDTVDVLAARDGAGGTLVAVDDDPVVLALVRALAERERLQVITVADATRFIEVAAGAHPSVLVIDVDMPQLSGMAVLRQLRAHPDLRRTPVMMLTSHAEAETRTEAFAAGADDFMLKPLVPLEFQRRVQALLSANRRARARDDLHPGTGMPLPARTWHDLARCMTDGDTSERSVVAIRPVRPPDTPDALAAVQTEGARVVRHLLSNDCVAGLVDDVTVAAVVHGAAPHVAEQLTELAHQRMAGAPSWHAGIMPLPVAPADRVAHQLVDAAMGAADVARELGVTAHVWAPADGEAAPDVILVEDDAALAELLGFALRQQGFTWRRYADGPSALRGMQGMRVRQTPIVLLDLDLPGLDGHSVHEQLREQRPGAFAFVFLSAHAGETEQLRALQAGALDYVVKPVSLRVLMAKLVSWRSQVHAA